ncbi:MAG: hypothetical protein LC687_07740 [Actinobacteria bacterium]|nr:hypothetical protein [Actinomycetota bacterium]
MENYRIRWGTYDGVKVFSVYEDNIPIEDYMKEEDAKKRCADLNRQFMHIQRKRSWEDLL